MESVNYRGRTVAVCWECEAPTIDPVDTALGSLTVRAVSVVLCPECYRACYVPLVAYAAGSQAVPQAG
jgi:hypothetical protein